MKKFTRMLLSILIVITVNKIIIAFVAFSTETMDSNAIQLGTINDIVFQENKAVSKENYSLLNWGFGNDVSSADEAFLILDKTKYEKVSFTEQVAIQLIQNRFNSVIMLYQYPTYYRDNADSYACIALRQGSASKVVVVKLFNNYYLIVDYIENNSVTENNKLGNHTTAVYSAIFPESIKEIETLQTEKTHYSSYSFYPLKLAQYVATPISKITNISGIILEIIIVYNSLLRRDSKIKLEDSRDN